MLCAVLFALVLLGLSPSGWAFAQEAAASGGGEPEKINWLEMGLAILAGLTLFLYGVRELSNRLREVASDKLRRYIQTGSSDRVRGLVAGAGATVLLDSSSATIILLITLVDAGLIGSAGALPIILGSNIGTTISSQIFALNGDLYAPVLLAAGLLWMFVAKDRHKKAWGGAILSLGLILFALGVIGQAVEPLEDRPGLREWLTRFEAPLIGVAAGAAMTVALQSSSAMMAIIIVLAGQGLISLEAGLALMLGAEIGTCADTLVATLGRSRAALRAGIFHLGFNLVSALAGVAMIGGLAALARWSASSVDQQIANAHVAFNVIGALIFLPFVGLISRALDRFLPDTAGAGAPAAQPA